MLNKQAIFARCPWLKAGTSPHNILLGDDLDAALSAALYLHTHPQARAAGIYSKYTTVYYDEQLAWNAVLDAVWLDLDIYRAQCRSLGHHIVRLDRKQELPGFANSLNLNDLWGKSLARHFDEKYPLGTVHFLMWLNGKEIPPLADADLLLWLADSAFINAQASVWRRQRDGKSARRVSGKGYRMNVKSWLYGAIQVKSLQRTFEQVETLAFEERMQRFQERLRSYGFSQGEGQVASHHLKLSGYQCQPNGDVGEAMLNLLDFCAAHTGWHIAPEQLAPLKHLKTKRGSRHTDSVKHIREQGLGTFLEQQNVFSYVFTHADCINYTMGF